MLALFVDAKLANIDEHRCGLGIHESSLSIAFGNIFRLICCRIDDGIGLQLLLTTFVIDEQTILRVGSGVSARNLDLMHLPVSL